MPRKYVRVTNRGDWSHENLLNAMSAISNKEMSIRKASKAYGIPFSTLQERIKKGKTQILNLGRKPVFCIDFENDMTEHIKDLAKLFYGITPLQLRSAAFAFGEENKLQHNFNRSLKLAGIDWFYNFIRRNPSITIRKPEATSIGRITAFNKTEVSLFFENLEMLMEKYSFIPSNIFNMDETGISTVQDPGKIIAPKGQKRVGSVTSWERGKNVTVICSMSASGTFVPPVFIFPRKRMCHQLQRNGPPGAVYQCTKNGWSNEDIFLVWLQHFVSYTKPSTAEPVLLILDNHGSHINLPAYDFCKKNNIIMLSLPPHTSHRMQPLDVTFFGPLKQAFKRECDLFMKSNSLIKITPYDLAELFNKAYSIVATIQKGVSGFSSTGIYPMNPNVFTEEDFFAANTFATDDTNTISPVVIEMNSTSEEPSNSTNNIINNSVPSTSTSSEYRVAFKSITPIPKKPSPKVVRRRSAKQHSTVITSTPMKTILELKENKRKTKIKKEKPAAPPPKKRTKA